MQSSDQVEAYCESFPPVAVTLGQDTEDFQAANDVLDHDPATRQRSVALLLPGAQLGLPRFLLRRPALGESS